MKNFLSSECSIDIHEHYIKQTIRNRCSIVGPNGKQELIIPVNAPNHTPMKDVTIEYSDDWQRKHWGAIKSSYGQSPFFNFYSDKFEEFYRDKSRKFLVDLNHDLLQLILEILREKKELKFSEEFVPYKSGDQRTVNYADAGLKNYVQVFSDRFSFMPDLSVIDLLFCTGPEAKSYLSTS